jgi:PAS domain S-box-containing protein
MNAMIALQAAVTVGLAILAWWLTKCVVRLNQMLNQARPPKSDGENPFSCEPPISEEGYTETESKLRSYLKLMDTLINTIPNPIFYMNLEGSFLGCNQAFAKTIIGMTRDRIIGKQVQDLKEHIPQDLASCLDMERIKKNLHGDGYSFESEVTCVDEQQREYLFTVAAVFDTSGKMNGSVTVMQDLTDKNRASRHRLKSEKLQGVLEITGAVCHELNQPLQALSGYVELAEVEMTEEDQGFDQVRQMRKQIDRMATITGKLQRITRYETMDYVDNTKIIDIDRSSEP